MTTAPSADALGTSVSAGYARVVNANPLTGLSALLGEFAPHRDNLETFGRPRRDRSTLPLTALLRRRPDLGRQIASHVREFTNPTECLIRFRGEPPHVELLAAQPLGLSAAAALRFFHLALEAGRIGTAEFLRAVPPETLMIERARLVPGRNAHLDLVTQGTPVSGGPTKGVLVRDAREVATGGAHPTAGHGRLVLVDRVEAHHTVLLNDPDCVGVLAVRGSPADHFAVLAREKDFPYLVLDGHAATERGLRCPDRTVPFGRVLTIDFATGRLYLGDGAIDWELADPVTATVRRLLAAVDSPIPLRVNADTADDLPNGLPVGAAGIGLLRTEHVVRRGGMHLVLRRYLESEETPAGREALTDLAAFFERELVRCFALAGGLPVAVRLLDYPLHELGGDLATEVNPMLGLRGVRQGLRWPALYRAQIEAVLRAAGEIQRHGLPLADPEIMAPLVNLPSEMGVVRRWLDECRDAVPGSADIAVKVGAMVETPAAALAIEGLAAACDFLSFGTNDLTQLLFGLSREDYPATLRAYRQHALFRDDPFERLQPAVLRLVRDAAARARRVRPAIALGLCGAHAADPQALTLCEDGLLDYLSVSRHVLPRVKLVAIQRRGAIADGTTPGEQP